MTRSRDIADQQKNIGGAVAPFVAGKNKLINGDFGVWQRGTSFSNPNGLYTADRFQIAYAGTPTFTISQQVLTPGSISGYESPYCLQHACTVSGGSITDMYNKMENVQTFAGQTITISFWAKAVSGTPVLSALINQNFGSGGSAAVDTSGASFTLTSSWVRYSTTIVVPSITGKTIGAGSYLLTNIRFTHSVATFQIWGVQVEAGSVATPFTTASGTIAGELELCKRYYQRYLGTIGIALNGICYQSTGLIMQYTLPTEMRAIPSAATSGQLNISDQYLTDPIATSATLGVQGATTMGGRAIINGFTAGTLTVGRYYSAPGTNAGGGYTEFSAEL